MIAIQVITLALIIVLLSYKLNSQHHLLINKLKQMATKEELNAGIDKLQADLDAKQAALATLIQSLKDQIAAGTAATPEDLQAMLDKITAVDEDVNSTPAE